MPDYDIVFESGKSFKFRGTPCFAELYDLRGCLRYRFKEEVKDMVITKDYKRVDRDKVDFIIYYPKVKPSLPDTYVDKYIEYLYYHRGWGKWILNDSIDDIMEKGFKIDASGYGEHLLGCLQAIRYLVEKPNTVISFNKFISDDFGMNPDIAFIMAHSVRVDELSGKIRSSSTDGHSIINTSLMTINTLKLYATEFPYKPISKVKYNDILDPRKVHEYMSWGAGIDISLYDLVAGCGKQGSSISKSKLMFEINRIQKGVDKLNEAK